MGLVDVTMPVYSIVNAEKTIRSPWIRFPVNQLRASFREVGALEVRVSVNQSSTIPGVVNATSNAYRISVFQETTAGNRYI